jgi:hypothetical protein
MGEITKVYAQFQPERWGWRRYERWSMFRAPAQCILVKGPVAPKSWCQFFWQIPLRGAKAKDSA